MSPRTVDELLAEARSRIRRRSPAETAEALARGALVIDIRPAAQRQGEGEVPGAIVIERNVLEWRMDPASPHRLAEVTGHDQEIVVISSEGYASSLVAATLVEMGFASAGDVDGGFQAWSAAGLPVRRGPDPGPPPGGRA
ncbi:MAG: rhodanese-like domain-containing protein [Acidimicrobiia bacterium]